MASVLREKILAVVDGLGDMGAATQIIYRRVQKGWAVEDASIKSILSALVKEGKLWRESDVCGECGKQVKKYKKGRG